MRLGRLKEPPQDGVVEHERGNDRSRLPRPPAPSATWSCVRRSRVKTTSAVDTPSFTRFGGRPGQPSRRSQARSATRASARSCARSRRRNGWPSRPTSSVASCVPSSATARSSGPVVPSATSGDAAVPAASAIEQRLVGAARARIGEHPPVRQQRGPVGEELVAEVRHQFLLQRRHGVGLAQARRGLERVETGVGERRRRRGPLRPTPRRPPRSRGP